MRSIITNPIKLFAFIVILLSLILLIGCQFHCPDIYLDREALGNIYNQYQDEILLILIAQVTYSLPIIIALIINLTVNLLKIKNKKYYIIM